MFIYEEYNNKDNSVINCNSYHLNDNNEIQYNNNEDYNSQPIWNIMLNENNIKQCQNKELDDKISTKYTLYQKKADLDIKNEIIDNDKKQTNWSSKKNHLGRKTKSSNEDGKHNKYSEDNIIRKIKSLVIAIISAFLNEIIAKIYNNNIGKGIFKKELLKMNQNQIIDLKSDKEFINKKLKDIFSNDISTKYTCYNPEHNKLLIEELLNENDFEKRQIFDIIFSISFLECIKHIRGEINIIELDGIETLDKICEKYEDDKDYVKLFRYYFLNFESIIMRKRNKKKE